MQWRISIVSVVFSWVVLVIVDLCRVNNIGLGEDIRCFSDLFEINFGGLMHLSEFLDVALKLWSVGQTRGHFFRKPT